MDKNGKVKYELSGSWLSKIELKNVESGQNETIWQEDEMMPDYKRQFFFNYYTLLLNYKSNEMNGTLAPTDSRFRNDMRLFEEGKLDEADQEKIRLEVKQRKLRKDREEANITWKPQFFNEVNHPHVSGLTYY